MNLITLEINGKSITVNKMTLNAIAIAIDEESKRLKAEGYDTCAEEAHKVSTFFADTLERTGYYK